METDIRIVILQRGWVMVGDYKMGSDGVTISNAKSIRRWGTTEGLGQLRSGPRPDTNLDQIGNFNCHPLQVIGTITDLDQEKWTSVLKK